MTLGACCISGEEKKRQFGVKEVKKGGEKSHAVGRVTYSFDQQKVG